MPTVSHRRDRIAIPVDFKLHHYRKLRWVAAAYGVVLAISVFLVVWRYLQYRWHAQDADLYGGMWAGGDMILGVFLFCFFLVPTFALVLVIRDSEPLYTRYAKVLLGLGLSAPLSLGLISIPQVNQGQSLLGWVFFWRILGSPFVFLGLAGVGYWHAFHGQSDCARMRY